MVLLAADPDVFLGAAMDLVSVELGGLNRGVNEHEFGFAVDMTANARMPLPTSMRRATLLQVRVRETRARYLVASPR